MANILRSFLLAYVLFPILIYSKDYGTLGHTFLIEEEDLFLFIREKFNSLSDKEKENLQKQFVELTLKRFQEPKSLKLKETSKSRVFYFDPSVTCQDSIKDSDGNTIIQNGSKVNPLTLVSLTEDLLFFDANIQKQIDWAKRQSKDSKWILVNGNPFDLEIQENKPVYFDQGGVLTGKLKIMQVPARVTQEDLKLKIEEILLENNA